MAFPDLARELHPLAVFAAERLLSAADVAMPGLIVGLYVVGSAALDDFVPGRCDLDFVVATAARPDAEAVSRLAAMHTALAREEGQPALDGIYVARDDLDAHAALPPGPAVRGGRFEDVSHHRRRAVDRLALADHGIALREPPPTVWHDDAQTARWARDTLRELGGAAPAAEMDEAVLVVCRLHYLLATCRIPSKSEAGLYGLITFEPRWRRILDEALRLRRSPHLPNLYADAAERRRDALAFIGMAAVDGLSLA